MSSIDMIKNLEFPSNRSEIVKYLTKGVKLVLLYISFIFICFCLCFMCEAYYHNVCCPLHLGVYHGLSSCIVKSTSVTCYVSRSTSDYIYNIIVKLYFDFFRRFF